MIYFIELFYKMKPILVSIIFFSGMSISFDDSYFCSNEKDRIVDIQ